MTPVRLIHVGLGGWGRDWARLITRQPDVAVVACVDQQPDVLAAIQQAHAIPEGACFTSLDAALAGTAADAVLVTTSLAGHVPVALAALAAGKHVLLEKPFAPSLAEAEQVVAAAAAQNRTLMISQNYRFYPAVRAVADVLRAQELGPVSAVTVQFRKYANTAPVTGHRHYALVQPLLMDMAIHHFDLMRYVLGQEPVQVTCHAWNPPWSNFRDPAAAVATITFDGGAVVDYQGNWVSTAPDTPWAGLWHVECAGGEIVWTSRADTGTEADMVTVRPRGKRARRVTLPPLPQLDRAGTLAAFVAAIRTGQAPETSGRDNLGSVALMFAAIHAAKTGQPQIFSGLRTGV